MAIAPEICPNCGAEVPPNAKACPGCGSCAETGWSGEAHASGLGLPDDNFDYDDYLEREFGKSKPVPRGMSRFWWVIAVLILALILAMIFL
ncbi:zinc ribbon domain-containing protein [Pedosphaera parvula]|uniref:Zinc-ribbon domain-containing protein n=1 Tax=Pedosphaera parvula (strain Ellin514) TaxID=320771 RepID=B9XFJ6_PEDPL|nr:zinc ribbon domain-containing protein [Pedosphaera parvula]EEF61360.1 hypothetical protein Cflav_PD4381 [Pedosphaera parvula Ellin514]